MSRKHIAIFAVLSIAVMLLVGCQGYQAPKYKSPNESVESEDVEEVNIDVSDVGEETAEEDASWEETSDEEETVTEETTQEETAEEPATTSKTYTPAVKDTTETTTETDFTKSPYRSVVEDNLPTVTVAEGELVKVTLKATDPDGDKLAYTFTVPLNSEGKWQTRAGDAGVYYSDITVSDGLNVVKNKIKIVVEPKNNKPVLQFMPNVEVDEGDTVTINVKATDKDGDKLTYTYSGWMSTSSVQTDYTDAGVHKVTVSVSDGISTVSQEVTVTVKDVNRAPEVEIEF